MVAEKTLEGGRQDLFLEAHGALACWCLCARRAACERVRATAAAGCVYLLGRAGLLRRLLAFTLRFGEQRARQEAGGRRLLSHHVCSVVVIVGEGAGSWYALCQRMADVEPKAAGRSAPARC